MATRTLSKKKSNIKDASGVNSVSRLRKLDMSEDILVSKGAGISAEAEYLLEENKRLRAELIEEKQVGMRPGALVAELNKLSPAERYQALQVIEAFVVQYRRKQNENFF